MSGVLQLYAAANQIWISAVRIKSAGVARINMGNWTGAASTNVMALNFTIIKSSTS